MNDVSPHEAWGYYAAPIIRVSGTEKYIAVRM